MVLEWGIVPEIAAATFQPRNSSRPRKPVSAAATKTRTPSSRVSCEPTSRSAGTNVLSTRSSSRTTSFRPSSAPETISSSDTGWLVFTPTSLAVAEPATGTATGTYTVKLNAQPAASVTLNLSRGSGSSRTSPTNPTFSPSSLTFTTQNWDTAQTVTVTVTKDKDGVDDVVNIRHAAASTGAGNADFNNMTATLPATEIDNNDAPTSADFTRYVQPKSADNSTSLRPSLYFPFTDTDTPPDGLEAVVILSLPDSAQGTLNFYQRRVRQGPRWVSRTTPVQVGNLALTYVGEPSGWAKQLYFYPSDSFSSASFTYRVKDKSGNFSDATYTVTLSLIGNAPAKPTGFTAAPGNEQVTLSWNDPSDTTITAWQYQQRIAVGLWGNWTDICTTAVQGNSCKTTTSYTVTGLTNNTAYVFKIRATSATGTGGESDLEHATPAAAPAPVKLQGFAATGDATDVDLAWTDPSDNAIIGYQVRRREQGGNLAALAGDRQVTLAWDNPHAPTVWDYQYRFRAGDGTYSSWTAMPALSKDTHYTVTGLTNDVEHDFQVQVRDNAFTPALTTRIIHTSTYTRLDSNNKVTLGWNRYYPSHSYWQYRKKEGSGDFGAWTSIPGSNNQTTSWQTDALTAGTTYEFQVRPGGRNIV